MEAENKKVKLDNNAEVWKKSWVAYVRLIIPFVIIFVVSMLVSTIIMELITKSENRGIYSLLLVFFIVTTYLVIMILSIRSYKLFYDDDGIWVYSGIFPWSKGISGIKWRDLDEAVYRTGFISWAAHSYNIRLSHRYTKASEIGLNDISNGDKAVATINELHIEYLRKNEK